MQYLTLTSSTPTQNGMAYDVRSPVIWYLHENEMRAIITYCVDREKERREDTGQRQSEESKDVTFHVMPSKSWSC